MRLLLLLLTLLLPLLLVLPPLLLQLCCSRRIVQLHRSKRRGAGIVSSGSGHGRRKQNTRYLQRIARLGFTRTSTAVSVKLEMQYTATSVVSVASGTKYMV